MKKHTYITGRSGSGKSEVIKRLFYQIQKHSQKSRAYSLVLIDPHGDLAEDMLNLKIQQNDLERVVYIDPYYDKNHTPILNPLYLSASLGAEAKAQMIDSLSWELGRIFQGLITGSQLSLQMEALLIPCIATLLRKGDTSLRELQTFMDDNHNQELLLLGQNSPHPNHRDFFQHAFVSNSSYRLTKQSIYTKLQSLLNSQSFYDLTEGESTIDLEKLIGEGKVIIFNLAQGKMGVEVSTLIGRLILALLHSIALRRAYQPKHQRKPCFVFVDECQNFLSPSMNSILAEARKYGLALVLANQHLGQISDKSLKEGILSNTALKFVGANNASNLSAMAKELGLKAKDLEHLKNYEFYYRAGQHPPRTFKVPKSFIKEKNKVKASDKKQMKAYMLKHYYKLKKNQNEEKDSPKAKYQLYG